MISVREIEARRRVQPAAVVLAVLALALDLLIVAGVVGAWVMAYH